jgi:hypothetical protein
MRPRVREKLAAATFPSIHFLSAKKKRETSNESLVFFVESGNVNPVRTSNERGERNGRIRFNGTRRSPDCLYGFDDDECCCQVLL